MYGLDVHKAIVDNIYENTHDYAHETFKLPEYVEKLIKQGNYGDKTKQGLYKIDENEVFDIELNKYRKITKYDIPFIDEVIEKFKVADYEEGIQIIMQDNSCEAQICRDFLINYIVYAITISKEVANAIDDCDIAMAEGFNWIPPYALLDVIGKNNIEKLLSKYVHDETMKNDLLDNKVKSKYRYEKFLKAKR